MECIGEFETVTWVCSKRRMTMAELDEVGMHRVVCETIEIDLRYAPNIDAAMVVDAVMTKLGREAVMAAGGRARLQAIARATLRRLYDPIARKR
jgi:hypothetical protein